MSSVPTFLTLVLAAALCQAQDGADARKARQQKLAEIKRALVLPGESDRLKAIDELKSIPDDEAIALLAGKLGTDTDAVRIAAAKAIAEHRRPASVRALGAALPPNAGKPEVLKAFIQALQDLDLCSCIPVLMGAAELNKYALAEDALKAIEKIGCIDAAPALVALLQKAEIEEKKPDTFDGVEDVADAEENKRKNKALAALVPKTRELLGVLAVKSFPTSREWAASIAGGKLTPKRTSVYMCTLTNTTFEVHSSGTKKCPYDGGKGSHDDVFLKHLRE